MTHQKKSTCAIGCSSFTLFAISGKFYLRERAALFASIIAVFVYPSLCLCATQASVVLERLQHQACQSYQADFDRIMAESIAHPSLAQVQQRLDLIDKVTASIISALEAHRAAFAKETLANLRDSTQSQTKAASALSLIESFRDPFRTDPIPSDLDAKDEEILRAYCHAYASARIDFVNLYAQTVAAVYPTITREAMELCLVLPFLVTNDDAWSNTDVDRLPFWIKPPGNLAAIEIFALRAEHVHSAYLIHASHIPQGIASDQDPYPEYLSLAADQLLRLNDFDPALFCLDTAVKAAESKGKNEFGSRLRFRVADLLATTSHFTDAANAMQIALTCPLSSIDYGRGVVLRLKYLVDAKQFADVLKEAPIVESDERCRAQLPQIFYIAWVAAKQNPNTSDAEQSWRKNFIARFPNHPLAADMYLAMAMQTLAANDRENATRQLQFIERQYPSTPSAIKAHEMERDLESSSSPASQVPPR